MSLSVIVCHDMSLTRSKCPIGRAIIPGHFLIDAIVPHLDMKLERVSTLTMWDVLHCCDVGRHRNLSILRRNLDSTDDAGGVERVA